jgi:2-polyprenyl-3-methyl-5-hydroxy-6-metoxy-1,4-benzoquinol methylase
MSLDPAADWEKTDCPGCQCNRGFVFLNLKPNATHEHSHAQLIRCPDCQLVFLSPRPNRNIIGKFYSDDYAPHQANKIKHHKKSSKEFSSPPPEINAKLLDYGCGNGAFLSKMKALGWEVTGLDASANAIAVANVAGIKALQGDFKHPEVTTIKFDCITLRQVLEHLHNPLETLNEARNHLATKGKISISVPNIESLPYRWFKEDWLGIDFPRHLLFFNPQSLESMLRKAGLKVLKMKHIRHSSWLRESASNALKAKGFSFKRWMGSKKLSSSVISLWAGLTNQCDCIQVLAEEED